jgi:hypothetical protein
MRSELFEYGEVIMIGISVEDYGIGNARHGCAGRILEDLKSGVISSFASEEEIARRYGNGTAGSGWLDFRRASRAYATLHGCLVLVDDDRKRIVDSTDINGDYDPGLAAHFFRTAAVAYLKERRQVERTSAPHVSARMTLYRMPRADYRATTWDYFEKRGEYIGEQVVAIPTTSHIIVR